MKKYKRYRSTDMPACSRVSVCLLLAALSLCIASSCSNESSPVGPGNGGEACIHYEDYQHIAGSCDTLGYAKDVAVAGDYAYVVDHDRGIAIIDIREPGSPTIVGSVDLPGEALGVAVLGDYAYVANYSYGLQVIDIRMPGSPVIVRSVATPDNAWDAAASGDCVYVADDSSGLQVAYRQCEL